MNIDQNNGAVVLPNGFSIVPSLSQNDFRQTTMFGAARAQSFGTPPWIHYHISGGEIDDRGLLASLCFYDQLLVGVSLTAIAHGTGERGWSDYSLDIEAATKEFHDRILEQLLGKPTRSERLEVGHLSSSQLILARPLVWRFRWGEITSGHDFKGGGTSITIRYGDRHEQSCRAYAADRGKA